MVFIISISKPGKSWNLSEGQEKSSVIYFRKTKRQKDKKKTIEKITDESASLKFH